MKLAHIILALTMTSTVHAFVPAFVQRRPLPSSVATKAFKPLRMSAESDFASAMPAKPEQTFQEKMEEAATKYITYIKDSLGEGVEGPPELEALEKARDNGEEGSVLAVGLYELMCEHGMMYDRDEDGILTPTDFDIKNNLDIPEVKQEFSYLYKYGMNLINQGILEVEKVKDIVKERLIDRTGLTPEEFDEWLGY